MVIHSSKLVYPRELYQRGVERKRVELIAAHFNEYVANEPKVSFRNGQFIVTDGQHTIEGRILRNGGKDLPILCKVYTGVYLQRKNRKADLGAIEDNVNRQGVDTADASDTYEKEEGI